MKSFENAYGYDDELAKGKWFTLESGIKVNLAYGNTPHIEGIVQDAREKMIAELGRELTNDESEELGTSVFTKHMLRNWETPEGEECTIEAKTEAIDKYPAFISECIDICNDNKRFQEKRIDTTVKKSCESSSGSRNSKETKKD